MAAVHQHPGPGGRLAKTVQAGQGIDVEPQAQKRAGGDREPAGREPGSKAHSPGAARQGLASPGEVELENRREQRSGDDAEREGGERRVRHLRGAERSEPSAR